MQVTIRRNEQLIVSPTQSGQEGDDEPPDPNPCLEAASYLSTPNPLGRLVRFPTQRAGILSPAVRSFRKRHFPSVPTNLWNNWQWQTSHRIRRLSQLESMISLSDDERASFNRSGTVLPLGITPYYMSLVSPNDPNQPIRNKTRLPKGPKVLSGYYCIEHLHAHQR